MPKLIDYPRTSYTGAWELTEIVDDTGGKCAIDTAARKLNRKVSGSFKAIIGSAVKFGLMTSKRELLTTTTLFRRIKHAYDKAEELQFHREAFLTPPLFTQLCRKFRNRELPVQMLDVMLIREFGVEEINAQSVAKAFVDGCRMCGLIDERNIIADIDAISARTPRRELSSPTPALNTFEEGKSASITHDTSESLNNSSFVPQKKELSDLIGLFGQVAPAPQITTPISLEQPLDGPDAIASLFGLAETSAQTNDSEVKRSAEEQSESYRLSETIGSQVSIAQQQQRTPFVNSESHRAHNEQSTGHNNYQMQMSGPGVNTLLDISEEEDIAIAIALLEKIRRQLRANA